MNLYMYVIKIIVSLCLVASMKIYFQMSVSEHGVLSPDDA